MQHGSRRVHREQHGLSFLNNMMHSPAVFKEHGLQYTSKACVNRGIMVQRSTVVFPSGVSGHEQIQANIKDSSDFLLLLIFKLLDRNIFISDRNVGVLEHTKKTPHVFDAVPGDQEGLSLLARSQLIHCDVMAFNVKKRLVYSISICDDPTHFSATCAHGLRLANCINQIKDATTTVVPLVLTMYSYNTHGSLRLYNPLCKALLRTHTHIPPPSLMPLSPTTLKGLVGHNPKGSCGGGPLGAVGVDCSHKRRRRHMS